MLTAAVGSAISVGRARTAGVAALCVSMVVGLTSNLLFVAAFQFRLDWFREPTRVLGAGATSAELLRGRAVLGLIGYYLADRRFGLRAVAVASTAQSF